MKPESVVVLMFLTGLTGGFGHCIGMCGPVVVSYSQVVAKKSMTAHLLYNLGRVSTYAVLGAAVGITGSLVQLKEGLGPLQKGIMVLGGVAILLLGLGMLGLIPRVNRIGQRVSSLPFFSRVLGSMGGEVSTGALFPVGIVFGFLPCGMVYSALAVAARAGMEAPHLAEGLVTGLMTMAAFGLGTMPALILWGSLVHLLSARLRARLYKLSAIIVIAMGVLFLLRPLVMH